MSERHLFDLLVAGWFVTAGIAFAILFLIPAPYGRHRRQGWGPEIGGRTGWIIMEASSPVVFTICLAVGENRSPAALAFFLMWQAHYVHRAFIYPVSMRNTERRMPLAIVGTGGIFNSVNAYLNGRWVFTFSGGYETAWLLDPRFIAGLLLFGAGYFINRQADSVLHHLRTSGSTEYQIPVGGLYHWVSCPNYLGEIIIWAGWAIATWSAVGAAFAAWTIANLAPRARSHHRWYHEHFNDYPKGRRALVPKLW